MILTAYTTSLLIFLFTCLFCYLENNKIKQKDNLYEKSINKLINDVKALKSMQFRTVNNPLPITLVKRGKKKSLLEKSGII